MSRDMRGAAPADHRNRPQDTEYAAAAKPAASHDHGTASQDTSPGLPALVEYVACGTGRPALDRLHAAAWDGRELIESGVGRTTVITALVAAAEVAGLPRRVAEEVLLRTLRSVR